MKGTAQYPLCNCESKGMNHEKDIQWVVVDTHSGPFALQMAEFHSANWCAVVNSAGGMFQLKFGEQ